MTAPDPASAPAHPTSIDPPPPGSFGDQVLALYRTLPRPPITSAPVDWLDPYHEPEVRRCMDAFYGAYYADSKPRLFLFGINPGRFGGGLTGIPFTDPVQLADACGIANSLPPRRELSAAFVHRVIAEWGGAASFFGQIYITAVSPLGLVRDGANFNYYDDRAVQRELEPLLVDAIRRQLAFGAKPGAVVIGTGKNFDVMQRLNAEHHFFDELHVLAHPRFVMQYRRREVDRFVGEYLDLLGSLLG